MFCAVWRCSILLVNVFSFSADSIAWDSPSDRLIGTSKMFFESKFWVLYSLLFGMGFYLQTQSALSRPSLASTLVGIDGFRLPSRCSTRAIF